MTVIGSLNISRVGAGELWSGLDTSISDISRLDNHLADSSSEGYVHIG